MLKDAKTFEAFVTLVSLRCYAKIYHKIVHVQKGAVTAYLF